MNAAPLPQDGRRRVVIENVKPQIDCGRFPVKRVTGQKVAVTADIFADGHDVLAARVLYRRRPGGEWRAAPMRQGVNDRWAGEFIAEEIGDYGYTVEAWVDPFRTWQQDVRKRFEAGQSLETDLRIGAGYLEKARAKAQGEDHAGFSGFLAFLQGDDPAEAAAAALSADLAELMAKYEERLFVTRAEKELGVAVDRRLALFSTWYELFPRSCAPEPGRHGTFRDCEAWLPEIARMGFDVLYLPPMHPIGETNRKGKNNSLEVRPQDPGSPWAIGSQAGGHKAVHPELGSLEDFLRLVERARQHGLETAMDLALQCSPDHPYVREHPQWFRWRPGGTIQYAENPPKKYEDIVPLNFETEDWPALWEELKSIVLFWIGQGIRIFRVDNPHTKPFAFWEWFIAEVKRDFPETIFLSEAFTRPKVMYRLAKLGFTQSYTYFTWRNTKQEITHYLQELTGTEVREYFRPNFWPNTPDILPEHLQFGGRPAFIIRLVLAATLAPSYGIYGPPYEHGLREALPGKEEYLDSEKYEIKYWDRSRPGYLRELITRVNRIRRENPALQGGDLSFYEAENDALLFYGRVAEDDANVILVAVNLDPFHKQSAWVRVPLKEWGIDPFQPYLVHDLLGDDKYIWQGERNYLELDPHVLPAGIYQVKKRVRREMDFDYFM